MLTEFQLLLWPLGRLLLGSLFVIAGIRHFFILDSLIPKVASRGVPAPKFTVMAASVFQALAGLALIAGWQTAWAAGGLVVFTLVVSVMLVNFWDLQGPERGKAFNTFFSNISIIGGLLVTIAHAAPAG